MAAEVLPEFHCVARRGEGAKSTPIRDCDILQIFWVVFFWGLETSLVWDCVSSATRLYTCPLALKLGIRV